MGSGGQAMERRGLEGFEALSLRGGAAEGRGSGTRPELDRFSSPSEPEVIEIDDTTVLDERSGRVSSEEDFEVIEVKREGAPVRAPAKETSSRSLVFPRDPMQREDSARSFDSSGRKRKRSTDRPADTSKNDSVRSKESTTGVSDRFQAFNVERSASPFGRAEFDAGVDVIDLEDDHWGDGAHLHWSPSPSPNREIAPPHSWPASPELAPEPAQILEELDYDLEDMAGGEGILDFEPGSFAADSSAEEFDLEKSESEEEEQIEVRKPPVVQVPAVQPETSADRRGRGMPDYERMDLDQLQVSMGIAERKVRDSCSSRFDGSTESCGKIRIPQEQDQGYHDTTARAMLGRAQSA